MEWGRFKVQFFLLGSLILLNAGCMNQVGGSAYPVQVINAPPLTDSQKAFNDTLFPTLIAQCSQCHGAIQGPLFAIRNRPGPSHDTITSSELVDFNNRPNSIIVTRVRGGHNCWSPDCNEDADALLAAIALWAKRVDPDSVGTGDLTEDVLIPAEAASANVCNETTGALMRFNLRTIDNSLPDPTEFQIRIRVASETSYEICDPQIVSAGAIQVEDIKIYVNGTSVVNQSAYRTIDLTTDPVQNPFNLHAPAGPVISPGAVIIPIRSGLGVDTLGFEFQKVTQ